MKVLAFLFSLISFHSLACSCMGYDIEEAFKDYPVVFSGVVESIDIIKVKEDGWFEYSKMKAVTLVVEQSYKGITAEKIKVTGNKSQDKIYHRHSGFPGGLYSSNFTQMQEKFPGRALEKAVKGMLPKGPLGYAMVKKLKIYSGDQHEHSAQQPKPLTI